MNTEKATAPVVPLAGRVYGEIVYWGTLLGCIVAIIGSVITFVTKNNYLDPTYILTAIWQGEKVEHIWTTAVGGLPHSHWYLEHLFTGNGIAEFGMVMGVFTVIPACLGAAVIFFKEKENVFGIMATFAALFTIASMIGLY